MQLQYKNFESKINFSTEAQIFFGEILYQTEVIVFQAKTVTQIEEIFKFIIDHYIVRMGDV